MRTPSALRSFSFPHALCAPRAASWIALYTAVWALVTLLTPSTSAAEESQQTKLSKAQRLIEEGSGYFKSKDYLKGIQAYEEAQRIIPDVKNLYVIATAYGYLPDQCQETLDAWSNFFKRCQGCRYKQSGLERYERQRARCLVTFKVTSPTPGLVISYQGERWGKTPDFSRELTARTYREVSFSAPGFNSYTRDVALKPEQGTYTVSVSLVPDLRPSFLDRNRAFIGGATGALALTSILYSLNQLGRYNDAIEDAKRVQLQATQPAQMNPESRLRLSTELAQLQTQGDNAKLQFWLGVGGALTLGSISAWAWTREPDVKIDTSLKPSMEPVLRLSWALSPWGAQLSGAF